MSYTVSCYTESNQVILSHIMFSRNTNNVFSLCIWIDQNWLITSIFSVMFESVLCFSAIVLRFQSPLAFRLFLKKICAWMWLFVSVCVCVDFSQSLLRGLVCLMYSCCLWTVQKNCYIIAIFIIWTESILLTAVWSVKYFRIDIWYLDKIKSSCSYLCLIGIDRSTTLSFAVALPSFCISITFISIPSNTMKYWS